MLNFLPHSLGLAFALVLEEDDAYVKEEAKWETYEEKPLAASAASLSPSASAVDKEEDEQPAEREPQHAPPQFPPLPPYTGWHSRPFAPPASQLPLCPSPSPSPSSSPLPAAHPRSTADPQRELRSCLSFHALFRALLPRARDQVAHDVRVRAAQLPLGAGGAPDGDEKFPKGGRGKATHGCGRADAVLGAAFALPPYPASHPGWRSGHPTPRPLLLPHWLCTHPPTLFQPEVLALGTCWSLQLLFCA
ncbi:hypothetical protein DFH09DRAFT_1361384 [Mycena vulgaris]|nr:hypothetical protein DFH09DRAFT_1361384 [Mycena vulgaris]